MKFTQTKLPGVFIVDIEPASDERGFFARSWCKDQFKEHGLNTNLSQCGISFNHKKGTLRGMHYQAEPHGEVKLVRCTRGTIFDVAVDLRQNSPTFKQWVGVVLSAENHRMLYIPEGLAHGLLTLEPNTEIFYQISTPYVPESARGVRWDDPAFKINWPENPSLIADRDAGYPDFLESLAFNARKG